MKIVVTLALILTTSAPASAQIRPLDENRLREATAKDAAVPRNDLVLARLTNGRGDYKDASAMKEWPFAVVFQTPYYRAYMAAYEAQRKFRPVPALSIDELNSQQVIIEVKAGGNFLTADTVEGLVIKRGDVIVRPTRESVQPTSISNALGAKRPSAIGYFEFPLETFAPESGAFTIVVIGKAGNFEWALTTDDLFAMR